MAGNTLNSSSTLSCPHGGTVSISISNTRVQAGGAYAALSGDSFSISGCSYQLPMTPPVPSPCATVMWLMGDMRVKAGGATLSESSSGLCLAATQVPQGQVTVATTQPHSSSE